MLLACVAAWLSPGPAVLCAALGACYIGIGTASGLAQATLVDDAGEDRARIMSRWTLLGTLGDLAAPAILAAVSGDWRLAYACTAALLAVQLVYLVVSGGGTSAASGRSPESEVRSPSLRLRDALRDRTLVTWLFAVALCDLLDEILIVFASLHVRDDLGGSTLAQSATVGAVIVGATGGLLAIDRVLKTRDELDVLLRTAVACALCYGVWLLAPGPWSCAALALPVGATAAPLYPLTSARAYATQPESSPIVLAAQHLFTPLGLALPFAIGVVADLAGTHAALALLAIQPLGIAAIAYWKKPRGVLPR